MLSKKGPLIELATLLGTQVEAESLQMSHPEKRCQDMKEDVQCESLWRKTVGKMEAKRPRGEKMLKTTGRDGNNGSVLVRDPPSNN